jgi:lipid-A-disaccharide synthase
VTEPKQTTILFTAFEPSGDALAASAARGLAAIDPTIRQFGLGGGEMEVAGVEMLAQTTHEAAMGFGAVSEIMRIKRLVEVVDRWIEENAPDVVVAVDSPAANFHVCKAARKHQCKVAHLAAPQLWGWAPWRIRKLRRLTDHVMCLLPFEQSWFEERGVKATFIGHPAMESHVSQEIDLPTGSPNIVMLPGSRASEIATNLPMQQNILHRICLEHQGTEAVIACREEDVHRVEPFASGIQIVGGNVSSVLEWADLALTVSGTVSLHVMRHATPMIGMYRVGMLSRIGAACLLNTEHRLLPNLIAGKKIVPEFIPCGSIAPQIAEVALDLLDDESSMEQQRQSLRETAKVYEGHHPGKEAAEIILLLADG